MDWKNWPYWIKGAINGLIVMIFFLLPFLSCLFSSTGFDRLGCFNSPIVYVSYSENIAEKMLISLGLNAPQGSTLLNSVTIPLGFVLLFSPVIIGAILGWIFGKIKNKQK